MEEELQLLQQESMESPRNEEIHAVGFVDHIQEQRGFTLADTDDVGVSVVADKERLNCKIASDQVEAILQPTLSAAESRLKKTLQESVKSVESQILCALQQAAFDIIEHLGREAATRVILAERKASILEQELINAKQQALSMLIHLKFTADAQITEAENKCLIERRRAQDAEAKLVVAQETTKRLKADLRKKTDILDKVQKLVPPTERESEQSEEEKTRDGSKDVIINAQLPQPRTTLGATPSHEIIAKRSEVINKQPILPTTLLPFGITTHDRGKDEVKEGDPLKDLMPLLAVKHIASNKLASTESSGQLQLNSNNSSQCDGAKLIHAYSQSLEPCERFNLKSEQFRDSLQGCPGFLPSGNVEEKQRGSLESDCIHAHISEDISANMPYGSSKVLCKIADHGLSPRNSPQFSVNSSEVETGRPSSSTSEVVKQEEHESREATSSLTNGTKDNFPEDSVYSTRIPEERNTCDSLMVMKSDIEVASSLASLSVVAIEAEEQEMTMPASPIAQEVMSRETRKRQVEALAEEQMGGPPCDGKVAKKPRCYQRRKGMAERTEKESGKTGFGPQASLQNDALAAESLASSRESRRLLQGARQLCSLSEKKWW